MKIAAIWERRNGRGVFALDEESGRLLYVTAASALTGYTAESQPIYEDTGEPEIYDAFDEGETYDYEKANWMSTGFGGRLVWPEKGGEQMKDNKIILTVGGKHKVEVECRGRAYTEFAMSHMNFKGKAISETGFRSMYVNLDEIEEAGGAKAFAQAKADELYQEQQERIKRKLYGSAMTGHPTLFDFVMDGRSIKATAGA